MMGCPRAVAVAVTLALAVTVVVAVGAAGCKKAEPPEVTFSLDRGQSAYHYGAVLTFVGGGHTISDEGHSTMVTVEVKRNGEVRQLDLISDEWSSVETLGVRWQGVEAPGFDPKRATFKMFRP